MIVMQPNKIGGMDKYDIEERSLRAFLTGQWPATERLVGWTASGGWRYALTGATIDGQPVDGDTLQRLGWALWGMGKVGEPEVDLPGLGQIQLSWSSDSYTKHPDARTDVARLIVFAPSVWPLSMLHVAHNPNAELTLVHATGTYHAAYVELDVPGCARTVDIRRFRARLSPGLYLAVLLDRWAVTTTVTGVTPLMEYGDHHGGKFGGIYKLTAHSWTATFKAVDGKGRDARWYGVAGGPDFWMDVTEQIRRAYARLV